MRNIRKGREPQSLATHRCSSHADYENYPDKQSLRQSLCVEQRGLCCYCMGRIHPTPAKMKIAHWHPQSTHPTEQLDYSNLLGACLGNMNAASSQQHCDTKQADRLISRNPAKIEDRVEELVWFGSDGRIHSRDPAFDAELNNVLNLNVPFLRNSRKAVLDGFTHAVRKRGPWQKTQMLRWLREWNGEADSSELQPFCLVVVYFLRRRLGQA